MAKIHFKCKALIVSFISFFLPIKLYDFAMKVFIPYFFFLFAFFPINVCMLSRSQPADTLLHLVMFIEIEEDKFSYMARIG